MAEPVVPGVQALGPQGWGKFWLWDIFAVISNGIAEGRVGSGLEVDS